MSKNIKFNIFNLIDSNCNIPNVTNPSHHFPIGATSTHIDATDTDGLHYQFVYSRGMKTTLKISI